MTAPADAMTGRGQAVQRPLPARPLPARPLPARPLPARPLPARTPSSGPRAAVGAPVTNATLVERIDLTDTTAIVRVRPDDGPRPFVPGQYFSLGLEVGGRVVQRPYSTSSAPGSAELEFLIRRVDGGALTPTLWATRVGARVSLGRAKGVFTLRTDDPRRPLLIATGTGLAPFVAMVRAGAGRPDRAPAVVVHGVAHAGELAYQDELAALAGAGRIAYVPVVSRPAHPANTGWTGSVGRVPDALAGVVARGTFDPAACVAYLCGNPGMIGAASAVLASLGVPPDAIVTERYWDPGAS